MFELSIILFGAGSVGRALISQILGKREFHARHYGLCLCVLAVCDSTAMVSKPGMALQDSHLQEILTVKGKEGSLIDHSLGVTQQDLRNAIGSFAKMGTVVVHQSGYTEPDPREDLGGTDVARKALILVRGLGWKMDLSDVEVVSLYPPHLDNMPATSFLEHLPHLDSDFTTRTHAAAVQGHVLRHVATIEGSKCRVGLNAVATDSPLGRLKGADNLIEIHSRWYSSSPLVIQGRGDGVNATAAGVLSDIIELGFSK